MTNIFCYLYYHYGIPTLFSEQIKTLLELKHKIIEDNDDYTLYSGQNYHFIQQQITEAHLIFESQDNQLKFITPYMRSFEINQGVLIKDIFNKEDL